MRHVVSKQQFLGFFPPYRELEQVHHPSDFPTTLLPIRGAALIWNMAEGSKPDDFKALRQRPPGVALICLLPPAARLQGPSILFDMMSRCRPHSVLPHQDELDTNELAAVLRRLPSELAIEVIDYLVWRGLDVDLETKRLLRKTLELSEELRTVSGLARALYMSRRALGRRFLTRGLPVPSHWLHLGRLLRASIQLQAPLGNLPITAKSLGYPDGFALSNQLKRLTGLRPSIMKECFGWEWIVEAWLRCEAESSGLSKGRRKALFPDSEVRSPSSASSSTGRMANKEAALRVGESHPKPTARRR